jgi:hypothetical protein
MKMAAGFTRQPFFSVSDMVQYKKTPPDNRRRFLVYLVTLKPDYFWVVNVSV